MFRFMTQSFSILGAVASTLACTVSFAQEPLPPDPVCIDSKCASTPVAGPSSIKWHPGHYMLLDSLHPNTTRDFPLLDQISSETVLKGVLAVWAWREVETAKGVYDFSTIDAYLAKLKSLSVPKRLIIRIDERKFGSTSGNVVPDYMLQDATYNGGQAPMANGVAARIWEAPVMDRYIALLKALAARYDNDPYVEAIQSEETAVAVSPKPNGFSQAAVLTQYKRMVAAARAAWPHTNVFISTNYLGSDAQMEELIAYCVANQTGIGGPDTFLPEWNRALQSDDILKGVKGSGKDYRGMTAQRSSIQNPELGGYIGAGTPAQFYDIAYNQLHANYIVWDRNTYYGGAAQKWDTGLLPFIRSVSGKAYTSCPSGFTSGCNTK
jgi:hypothetical protein